MRKHRSIIITSFAIFILLSCFVSQSEGRTILLLDTIFGDPSYNERCADYRCPLRDSLYYNFQTGETSDYTPFCSGSVHFFFNTEIFYLLEKRSVFLKWNHYIGTSQRPPPLCNHQLNT
jgi:hypothetical protein